MTDVKPDSATAAVSSVVERIRALETANAGLKAEAEKGHELGWKNNELARDIAKANADREKALAENYRLRDEIRYWKSAVRYEQTMKKPPRKVRHLPIFNSLRRTRYEDTSWVNRERYFLRLWRKENRGERGRPFLQAILSNDSNTYNADITQRDATVAATVIQWLGTNCGFAFLHEVNRRIEEAKKKKQAGD